MEEECSVICDWDVMIKFLDRGNPEIKSKLLKIGFQNICISAINAGALLVGTRDKKHFQKIQTFIGELVLLPVIKEVLNQKGFKFIEGLRLLAK